MTGQLISVPLPLVTFVLSLVAAAVILTRDFAARQARFFFAAVFALTAFGDLLVGLRFGYGYEGLLRVQRAVPFFAGPLIYLGFAAYTVDGAALRRRAMGHLGLALALPLLTPLVMVLSGILDVLIGLSYLGYAGLLLAIWWAGPNGLIRAPLDRAGQLARWVLVGAVALVVLFALDSVIAVSLALGHEGQAAKVISYAAIAAIAVPLLVILLALRPDPPSRSSTGKEHTEDAEGAAHLVARAAALLEAERLYLDSDLTVERLARRLHVPARALSGAVNRQKGVNMSQYVNGFRLCHAADLLRGSDLPVTQVMQQSGFLTRSNFYREFHRVYGQTPSAYRRGDSA